ncbi:hypothetical protein C8A05DRAFT_38975 [Staphylotrichum tortipilum]|uniref:Uncharacterized protein n=1 Tax=Staphylotrichum tortipilum TaxID=2831512 RepID=A0AAN6MCJ3_9PEZI|nr:hypothetical protein C8A05DRAFT_38975 [Staphylotrichum longicolle]
MAPNPKTVIRRLFRNDKGKASPPLFVQLRSLTASDASKPSLANLNGDTLDLLVECLHNFDPRGLKALSLVCSALYHRSRYVQLRDFSVDFNKDHIEAPVRLLSQTGLLPAVHTLRIQLSLLDRFFDQPDPFPQDNGRRQRLARELSAWNQLGHLIPQMPSLRHLHWTGLVLPGPVLDHLCKNPQIQLHLYIDITENARDYLDRALLKASSCRSVMADFLKPVLLSCRQIRTLALDISVPRTGCVELGHDTHYCGIGFTSEALPPLEDLSIAGYPWGQQSAHNTGYNYQDYPSPDDGTKMEYWARHMDCSSPSKKSTSTPTSPSPTASSSSSPPSPTPSPPSPCPATLALHSPTLRRLTIHTVPPSTTDLAALRDGLPNLTTLTLVGAREAEAWPQEALGVLAGFRSLEDVTLWFGLGPPMTPLKPYLTVSAAAEMFTYLRGWEARRLRRLGVYAGLEKKPRIGFSFSLNRDRGEWNGTRFVCEMEGEVGPGGALGATRGLKLNQRGNERLRRVAAGVEMAEWEKRDARFLVALRGPITEAAWMAWTDVMWNSPRKVDEFEGVRGKAWQN